VSARQTVRLIAWAQRQGHLLPRPARQIAGRAVRRLGLSRPGQPILSEDWTRPLIPGRPAADLESLQATVVDDPPAQLQSPPAVVEVTEPPIRCAVATGVLTVGGAEEVATFLARSLPRYGFETVVIHSGSPPADAEGRRGRLLTCLDEAGIPAVQLSPGTAGQWFAEHRPDVVHGNYAPDWMLDAAAAAGSKWVETVHGMHMFLDPSAWPAERVRTTAIAAQVAISEMVRRQYLAGNPDYPPDRVVTINNGIERRRNARVDRAAARAALGLTEEFLFLCTARYCLQKNMFGLVAAFAELIRRRPDGHLLVAGRPHDRLYVEQVRALASRADTQSRIHLRGHCANVPALLAAADAFVLDSFFEGHPLASMEAMAAGVPVIMSDVGGAREQLGEGGDRGYLVANPGGDPQLVDWARMGELRLRPQPNAEELIGAMSRVLDERAIWAASRDQLRAAADGLFPPEESVRQHAAVLRAVVRGDPLPGASPVGQIAFE
jgi:glycosyltransferase involved in cell wall biosynthesis